MSAERSAVSARAFLRARLEEEYATFFGLPPPSFIDSVVEAWMNDAANSKHRFESIEEHLPGARRILDMASGCGTAVFFGLLHGYDAHGIDPEIWKHELNALKAVEHGYPPEWLGRFHVGVGEALPFADDSFDCVTTYQTLEHVRDLDRVVREMIRVTRPGGGIHIRCPDYTGTFEGHYRLPWLPLLPRPVAKAYVRALGRPSRGIETLHYVTRRRLLSILARVERTAAVQLSVVDVDRSQLERRARDRGSRFVGMVCAVERASRSVRRLFREEENVELFVHVRSKRGQAACCERREGGDRP